MKQFTAVEENFKNYEEVYTVQNNQGFIVLTDLNQEWDNDFKEIKDLCKDKSKERPTLRKKDQLRNEMPRTEGSKQPATLNQSLVIDNPQKSEKYKSNILLFDDPSLHIRQSVNETYTLENLHFGNEDNNNLNKSIDCKAVNNSYSNVKNKRGILKKKEEINEKKVDTGGISNCTKKIIDSGEGFWTFSITVPFKQNDNK